MLDLVGNPNCWFCHAQAQFIHAFTLMIFDFLNILKHLLYKDTRSFTVVLI